MDISLIIRGRLYTVYSGCAQSSMLHGSETWPVRKDIRWYFSGQWWKWSDGCAML